MNLANVILVALMGFVVGFSSSAQAQSIFFGPSFLYTTSTSNNEGTETEQTRMDYDIKLGALLSSSIYVGGIYAQSNFESQTGSSVTEQTRTSYGASVGYMQPAGWFVIGHYFITSEFERSSTVTDQGGSGFQLDIGYLFDLGSSITLGPQISYKTFTYTERDSGTVTTDLDDTGYSELRPMVALGVNF